MPKAAATIVLVHGAWTDASSWNKVIPILQADGLSVNAAQLPLTSIEEDVAATTCAMADVEGPIVLVGHSGRNGCYRSGRESKSVRTRLRGGLCARRRRIRKWLDRSPSYTSSTFDGRHQQRGIRLPNGRWLREQCRARSSCAGCESHYRDTRAARGKGLRADCEGGSLDKPSWYILSTNDHVVSPSLQWAVAKRMDGG